MIPFPKICCIGGAGWPCVPPGAAAGAEEDACAKNTFKPFKCIIEKWSDTLGKLKELASVIGHAHKAGARNTGSDVATCGWQRR